MTTEMGVSPHAVDKTPPTMTTMTTVGGLFFQVGKPDDVWKAPVVLKKNIEQALTRIADYWLDGEGPVGKSLHQDQVFGAPLAAGLSKLVRDVPGCDLWNLLGPMFDWDFDELLWIMLHMTADMFCWERRTEFRYIWGDGATGKDVIGLLLLYFLGDRGEGGMSTIFDSSYFLGQEKRGAGIDTTLDQAKGMRSVICNEVPEHLYFNHDRVKALVEPRGSGILSRTIYAQPERWWPCLGLVIFSNHELTMVGTQRADTGNKRRINYLRLRHIFEESGLRDVKAELMTGKFNQELFFVCRLLLRYLKRCSPTSRRIHPRPPRVVSETDELFAQSSAKPLKDFMEDEFTPVSKFPLGTEATIIKARLAKVLGVPFAPRRANPELDLAMTKDGITTDRCGSKRIVLYKFPGELRAKACVLKPSVEEEVEEEVEEVEEVEVKGV